MTLERLLQIDRRVIFALMALAVAIPLITGITFDPGQTPPTKAIYDYIQDMKPGSVLVIVFDYGPASMPELDPMAAALIRHGLTRGLRVVGLTLDIQGAVLGDDVLNRVGRGMGKESGVDYVNLGYQPGYTAVILGMGEDIGKVFQTDFAGRPYGELRITKGLRTFKDIGLIIDLASSNTPTTWIAQAHERYDVTVATGVTAVMATDYYPYLQTNQLIGLLNGMKGAAEYEKLVNHPGLGMRGMVAQSISQFLIIALVIFGNIVYFISRRRQRRLAGTGG